MKKFLISFLILILILVDANAQISCDIKSYYEDFISVQRNVYNGQPYLTKNIVTTQKKSCCSGLVNNNPVFLDYLLTNFSSRKEYGNLLELTDSMELRKKFFSELRKDSLFNVVMTELISKTIDNRVPKDSITMDRLLDVAVKYFSITKLSEEGHYIGKVCVGLNLIEKTESKRAPFLEAFAFSSIVKHYKSGEFSMYDEFVKAMKELYKLNLGNEKEEKLLRAQGAMFILMRNNENLRKMLKSEYIKQKEFLPFVLVDR